MKNHFHPSPCGCGGRPLPERRPCPRPEPERRPCPFPEAFSLGCGGFLMQRIMACGKIHRRCQAFPLCLSSLPEQAQPPFTVLDVCTLSMPRWEEIPSCRQGCLQLRVSIPLQIRLRDGCGRVYTVSAELEEELSLRFEYPPGECWRGQPCVQAAVRLAGRACRCDCRRCDIPLEIMIEGYVLSPCTLGRSPASPCPEPRSWYPSFDPYR